MADRMPEQWRRHAQRIRRRKNPAPPAADHPLCGPATRPVLAWTNPDRAPDAWNDDRGGMEGFKQRFAEFFARIDAARIDSINQTPVRRRRLKELSADARMEAMAEWDRTGRKPDYLL